MATNSNKDNKQDNKEVKVPKDEKKPMTKAVENPATNPKPGKELKEALASKSEEINKEKPVKGKSDNADKNKGDGKKKTNVIGDTLDDCIISVIKNENQQLYKYAQGQLQKYATDDGDSITKILQLIGLSFKEKSTSNIEKAKSEKHDVIAIMDEDRYCIVKQVKDGFVEVLFSKDNVIKKVKLADFNKDYLGKILLVKNIKGSTPGEVKSSYAWFWDVIKNYRGFYTNVLVAAFVINLFGLIIPLFAMNVYDRVIPNYSLETLWALSTGVLIIIVFDFVLKMLRSFFVENTSKQIDVRLSNILFGKSLHVLMKDQTEPVGVRASKLKDFDSVRDFLSSITLVGIIDFPFLLITLSVIYYIGGLLILVPIGSLIIALTITLLVNKPLSKYTQRSVEGSASKNSLLFETLFNIETVKNFCMQPSMMTKWEADVKGVSKAISKVRFFSTFIVNATSSLGFLSSVIIVVVGTHLIWSSDLTIGGLIACSILSGRCLAPITQMTTIITRFQQVKCSLGNLNDMMLLEDERKGIREFYSLNKIGKDIEFQDVSFAYPGQGGEFFEDVSFSIKDGEKVAILGNSGSGKSTLFKLMSSLYAPDKGAVLISGINMMQIDPYILRSNIGYVEQNSRLFKGTLWSNVIVKNPKAKEEDIVKAIELSGVDTFAKRHPDGYNMRIDEAGSSLSGGQIQSIVLARALLSDPQIVLLDEPTSFMDTRLENNFIAKLKKFSEGKTLIVSTHKRALLELVDRIIVIDEGKIVADNRKDVILNRLFK